MARALYKRPKILFLDEATSHLDIAREHEVNAAVQSLNITRVIVLLSGKVAQEIPASHMTPDAEQMVA